MKIKQKEYQLRVKYWVNISIKAFTTLKIICLKTTLLKMYFNLRMNSEKPKQTKDLNYKLYAYIICKLFLFKF
jgi:hypothetical protein